MAYRPAPVDTGEDDVNVDIPATRKAIRSALTKAQVRIVLEERKARRKLRKRAIRRMLRNRREMEMGAGVGIDHRAD